MNDVQDVTEEDIKGWRKMSFELMRRSWLQWVLYVAAICGFQYSMGFYHAGKIQSLFVQGTIESLFAVFMFEVANVITIQSDKQFGFKQFLDQISYVISDFTSYKYHLLYIIFIVIILDTLVFPTVYVGGLGDSISKHDYIAAAFQMFKGLPVCILLVAMYAGSTIKDYIKYILTVHYKVPVETRSMLLPKVQGVLDQHKKKLIVHPLMSMYASVLFPFMGVFLLPYLLTWRYVAQREILFGGGNKRVVKKTKEVSTMVPQAFVA